MYITTISVISRKPRVVKSLGVCDKGAPLVNERHIDLYDNEHLFMLDDIIYTFNGDSWVKAIEGEDYIVNADTANILDKVKDIMKEEFNGV